MSYENMAIGIALGTVIGVAMENVVMGIGVGIAIDGLRKN